MRECKTYFGCGPEDAGGKWCVPFADMRTPVEVEV